MGWAFTYDNSRGWPDSTACSEKWVKREPVLHIRIGFCNPFPPLFQVRGHSVSGFSRVSNKHLQLKINTCQMLPIYNRNTALLWCFHRLDKRKTVLMVCLRCRAGGRSDWSICKNNPNLWPAHLRILTEVSLIPKSKTHHTHTNKLTS